MAENILRLKVDSQEYDNKIKRAAEGIQRFAEQVYKSGGAVTALEKDQVAFIKSLGSMETVSKTATGKLREMESAYKNLSATYHLLQKEQQNDEGGKALRASLDQLKVRIEETRTAIKKADSELNNFSQTEKNFSKESFDLNGILSHVGGQLGINTSLIGGLTTGTLGLTAAITAVASAEYKAAEAFKAYNDELAHQSQITTVTTGLKGDDANKMTSAARAISKVYGTEFRDVINSANTLINQFGQDGESAMLLIRQGMQGMIMGDGPKLLSMIQQFAPAFRDAGLSASQLIAIIHNSEGGLFSDQNMNAILMGIKNIRMMTDQTAKDLATLGVNAEDMSKKMNDGSMTVFEALQQVSQAIEGANASSKEAGRVMQDIFGRQGAMQGMKLGRAIATLNTNLEETKKQTGEVGESFDELTKKTDELDKAIMDLLKVDDWDVLKNSIETGIVESMTKCVNLLNDALDVVNNIGKAFGGPVVQGVVDFLVALSGPVGLIYEAYNLLKGGNSSNNTKQPKTQEETSQEKKAQDIATNYIANINTSKNKVGSYSRDIALLYQKLDKYQKEGNEEKAALTQRVIDIVEEHMDKSFSDYGSTGHKIKPKETIKTTQNGEKDPFQEIDELNGLIEITQQKISDIQQLIKTAPDEDSIAKWNKELEITQKELTRLQNLGKQPVFSAGLSGFNSTTMGAWMQGRQSDLSKATYGSSEYANIAANIADMNTIKTVLEQSMKAGIDASQFDLETLWEKVFDGENIPDETWQGFQDTINEKLAEMGIEPIKINFETGGLQKVMKDSKDMTKEWNGAANAISAVGSAMSQIEDPAAKVLGTIAQAIATIALSYAQAMSQAATMGPWAWLAFAGTGLATMISTISAIHSNTGYAEGGIIQGNSFSGDNIIGQVNGGGIVGLNSGELVLNRSEQGILSSALQGNAMKDISIRGALRGEDIVLVADRWGRRTGKGELAFWK